MSELASIEFSIQSDQILGIVSSVYEKQRLQWLPAGGGFAAVARPGKDYVITWFPGPLVSNPERFSYLVINQEGKILKAFQSSAGLNDCIFDGNQSRPRNSMHGELPIGEMPVDRIFMDINPSGTSLRDAVVSLSNHKI